MGRYFGKVGYSITVEKMTDDDPPRHTGVFVSEITEREYYGDLIKISTRWNEGQQLNDNLGINSDVSIIADEFAYQNFSRIVYVEVLGVKWKVRSVTPDHPRLTLVLGGEYNGPET